MFESEAETLSALLLAGMTTGDSTFFADFIIVAQLPTFPSGPNVMQIDGKKSILQR